MNEKQKYFVIGVSGSSKTGKDTFSDLLFRELLYKHDIRSWKVPLAHELKKDMESFLLKKCGLDIWNNEDKYRCRQLLVEYSAIKRADSKGKYFLDKVRSKIENFELQTDMFNPSNQRNIYIISDCRFKEYEYDELDYIKSNGLLIYIDKFHVDEGKNWFTPPANEHEAKNNVILKKESDYQISWEDCNGNIDLINKTCLPEVQKFIGWLKENKHIDG